MEWWSHTESLWQSESLMGAKIEKCVPLDAKHKITHSSLKLFNGGHTLLYVRLYFFSRLQLVCQSFPSAEKTERYSDMLIKVWRVCLSLSSPEHADLCLAWAGLHCASSTHPCRQTEPLSWSTAQWAGCSSPPGPPAGPCRRKHPKSELAVLQMSLSPGDTRETNVSYRTNTNSTIAITSSAAVT